jgi:hypothetical protein
MKNLVLFSSIVLLFWNLTGCTSVKRFKSATFKGEDHSLVDMALFGASLDKTGSDKRLKNLWDLSASAQTQLIQILNERYPDNAQFTGAMNQEYLALPIDPVLGFTTRDLRMVFTISRWKDFASIHKQGGKFSPADRIEHLKFSLEIPPEYHLHFTGWNRYTTEYGEIDIADVSFSMSLELEADVSGERSDGNATGSWGRKEDQVIRSRFLKLNGSISDRKMEIEEEGSRGIDLTGNVIADVSLAFDAFPERITIPLYGESSEQSVPRVTSLKFLDVMVPRLEEAPEVITARLEMEYVYRHVASGWKTFQEWDDRVDYYTGRVTKQIALFEKKEYIPSLYCLGSDVQGKEAVKIRASNGKEYPLRFTEYTEASRFLDWLMSTGDEAIQDVTGPVQIGEYTLLYRGQPLTRDSIRDESLMRVLPVY